MSGDQASTSAWDMFPKPTTSEEAIEYNNKILDALQDRHGLKYEWDRHWPIDKLNWSYQWAAPFGLYVKLVRNKCYIRHGDLTHDDPGEVQEYSGHWLRYNSVINGFNNDVFSTVQLNIAEYTFVYIHVR